MHCTRKVTDDLIYVGGSDRRLSRFENLFPVPHGVSYNSYLLLDEKTVLMDTADDAISRQFLDNVTTELGGRALDYLVVQHMEPDHCGMVDDILHRYPDCKLVCSAKALNMLGQFCGMDAKERALVVAEGDKLSTGRHTLHFIMAPMVHWPEVMVTYDEVSKVLFSADAFGTFGALPGNIFDDELCFDSVWMNDTRRYYANIVGKYGAQVQALLKKIAALDVEMVCSLHGPVWRGNLKMLIEKYHIWSTYEPEEKAVMIAYASMYGNTENAVNVLASLLGERGVRGIAMYDVSDVDVSVLVSESFRCSHMVLAAPTYNGGLYPRMEFFLRDIKALGLQKRTVALLENGTWAPVAAKHMRTALEGMKGMTVLDSSVAVKSVLVNTQLSSLEALADELALQLR
nr:FprA family A-type flavoprotein [uncultured Agathobaculum sp.]